MSSGIALWIRPDHLESQHAQAFLRQHRYAADKIFQLPREAPVAQDLDRLAASLGGAIQSLVDLRHPEAARIVPMGTASLGLQEIKSLLLAHPELLAAPILLTPKGALVGFRERKWRQFLDIGLGR